MPKFKVKVALLWNDRTTPRQFFKRVNLLHQAAKPSFGGIWFFPDIADKSNVVLGVD